MERIDEGAMLANWFAALKPGGQVIVVDHFGPSGDTRDMFARKPPSVRFAGFRLSPLGL